MQFCLLFCLPACCGVSECVCVCVSEGECVCGGSSGRRRFFAVASRAGAGAGNALFIRVVILKEGVIGLLS